MKNNEINQQTQTVTLTGDSNHMENLSATVIGLGQMGIKLAELLRGRAIPVTVWNRTIDKANQLRGVSIASDPAAAIMQNNIIVICVFDYKAVNEILSAVSDQSIFRHKTFINLTTGSPEDAIKLEKYIKNAGGNYLDGAIQVAPDQMGLPETTILVSGDESTFESHQDFLLVFGGNLKYLGKDISAASTMDLATLAWLYGSFVGLIHGAALVERAGIDLKQYSNIISEITPGFTTFFGHELEVIKKQDYTISQSPLAISVSATARIEQALESAGIDAGFHKQISTLFARADSAGYANEEAAAIIKLLRKKTS